MKPVSLTKTEARQLVLHSQLLDRNSKLPNGRAGVLETIKHLGYVQIDTIAVIERAHHHTIWTRRNDYEHKMLHDLQARDRKVFEYWGHAMSYLPMRDFRFSLPRMKKLENPTHPWFKSHLEKHGDLLPEILERVRQEGPLGSRDFENKSGKKAGPWWDWKPAKTALELLFWRGDLMISERINFQKIYDLTERVVPEGINTSMPSSEEIGRYLISRSLTAHGIASRKEIQAHLQPGAGRDGDLQLADRTLIESTLRNMQESKEVLPVTIEGDGIVYFGLSAALNQNPLKAKGTKSLHLLSPFDNLIIQRDRIKRLFNFNYIIECYVPSARRKFGYFVLPILWGDRLVGRLDPKADRKAQTLIINNLVFEPDFTDFEAMLPALAERIAAFAKFNQCRKVKITKASSPKIKTPLRSMINKSINT